MITAAGLTLAACGSGPSQVGAAAIVGNTSISVNQIQQELDGVLASQPTAQQAQQQGKLDQVSRSIVSTGVLRQVVAKVEQQEGIQVTDQQVQQVIDQSGGVNQIAGQVLADADGVHDLARDILVERALAAKYADTLSVTCDILSVADRNAAAAKVKQIAANPGSIDNLIKQAGQGGQANYTVPLGQYLQGSGQALQQSGQSGSFPDFSPLFGAPVNSVVAFQVATQQGTSWAVALVRQHNVGPNTSGGGSSAASADPTELTKIGAELMEPVAASMNIRISPRYGIWDPTSMQVVATANDTAGIQQAVGAPQS